MKEVVQATAVVCCFVALVLTGARAASDDAKYLLFEDTKLSGDEHVIRSFTVPLVVSCRLHLILPQFSVSCSLHIIGSCNIYYVLHLLPCILYITPSPTMYSVHYIFSYHVYSVYYIFSYHVFCTLHLLLPCIFCILHLLLPCIMYITPSPTMYYVYYTFSYHVFCTLHLLLPCILYITSPPTMCLYLQTFCSVHCVADPDCAYFTLNETDATECTLYSALNRTNIHSAPDIHSYLRCESFSWSL